VDTVLELRNLSKHFPTHIAVDGISLSLNRGQFHSLVGPSGCGKTTTLRLIAGLETPTSGDVLLEGKSIVRLKPYQRDVTTVFQNYALFPHLSVYQNVAFGLERRKLSKDIVLQRVSEALSLVELGGKEKRIPSQISGGERQRVALARALVLEPKVLLLDEPLSALDPKLRRQMRKELKDIQQRVGITFLFITHDQEEALSMSDEIAVINHGRIEQTGSPQELYRQPATTFVAEFLGDVNWLDGIGVRPEALKVSRTLPSESCKHRPATVQSSNFLGNCVHVRTLLSDGNTCVAAIPHRDFNFDSGDHVYLWWKPEDELRAVQ
jgi:spermidine/putrescine transport system ATP-binding protein